MSRPRHRLTPAGIGTDIAEPVTATTSSDAEAIGSGRAGTGAGMRPGDTAHHPAGEPAPDSISAVL